jgi:hypothetical protein
MGRLLMNLLVDSGVILKVITGDSFWFVGDGEDISVTGRESLRSLSTHTHTHTHTHTQLSATTASLRDTPSLTALLLP